MNNTRNISFRLLLESPSSNDSKKEVGETAGNRVGIMEESGRVGERNIGHSDGKLKS